MGDEEASLIEHIGELRSRVLVVVIALLIATVVGFLFSAPMINLIKEMLIPEWVPIISRAPMEILKIRIKASIVLAMFICVPLLIYEAFKFVAPGLYENEKNLVIKTILPSIVLFFLGVFISFSILRYQLNPFLAWYSEKAGIPSRWSLENSYDFVLKVMLAFGLIFQFPLVLWLMMKAGLMEPDYLKEKRKYAYGLIIVMSALVTPGSIILKVIVVGILIGIYELCLRLAGRKKATSEDSTSESS